jgi:hypothetical protein
MKGKYPDPRQKRCATHKFIELPYIAAYEDAQKRMKKGQKQKRCPECKYLFWPDQF